MRWCDLGEPWKRSFLQAWEAYCHGSIPIGAVLVNQDGEIMLEGRNRIHEKTAPAKQICSNRLAHAEMNVLLQLELSDYNLLEGAAIYSTMEPCIQCFGAIILSKIKQVYFAALDDKLAGGTTIKDQHGFIASRNIKVNGPHPILSEIQMILRTDFLLRYENARSAELIAAHAIDYPIGVSLGKDYFASNKLLYIKDEPNTFPKMFDEMVVDIRKMKEEVRT